MVVNCKKSAIKTKNINIKVNCNIKKKENEKMEKRKKIGEVTQNGKNKHPGVVSITKWYDITSSGPPYLSHIKCNFPWPTKGQKEGLRKIHHQSGTSPIYLTLNYFNHTEDLIQGCLLFIV